MRSPVAAVFVVTLIACTDTGPVAVPTPLALAAAPVNIIEQCDPEARSCDVPPGGSAPAGISLPGYTHLYCRSATTFTAADIDGDRLRDECEYQLAAAFAPMLVQGNEAPYGYFPKGVPGEYVFAVGPAPASPATRIAYMPAYYKDLGDLYTGNGGHSGDSEFIIVEVQYDAGTARWLTVAVFLSSHCGAVAPVLGFIEADPNCQWWGPDRFAYVNNVYQGAPQVWVADNKHANYFSYSHCQGGTLIDRCDVGPRVYQRFPISRDFHLLPGSRLNWAILSPRRAGAPMVDPTKVEDFWRDRSETRFGGWQTFVSGGGAEPYGNVLRFFNVFYNPGIDDPNGPCDPEAKACG